MTTDLDIISADFIEAPQSTIDIDLINDESNVESQLMLGNILEADTVNKNPQLKRRLTIEIENLRQLLKMRKTAEHTHDIIVQEISANNANAVMYKVLTDTQKTLVNLIAKTNDVVAEINKLYTAYQLKFEFPNSNSNDDEESSNISLEQGSIHRGTKDFIKSLSNKENDIPN